MPRKLFSMVDESGSKSKEVLTREDILSIIGCIKFSLEYTGGGSPVEEKRRMSICKKLQDLIDYQRGEE